MEAYKHTSLVEEIANSVTHGVGLLLSAIGIVFLALTNFKNTDRLGIFGLAVFGLSVILVYAFSTLYHSFYFTKANNILKRLDQSGIYLLIAGTYTPFILTYLKNRTGLVILLLVWLVSLLGIAYKVLFIFRKKTTPERGRLQLLAYLALGWASVFFVGPIISSIPMPVVLFLLLGGVFYSAGTIFVLWKKLKFNHSIWHLFVLAGTACQFLALLLL